MAHLALSTLGGFEVTLDGRTVTGFVSVKVRALLAYLALEPSRAHRRDALAGLLWPEFPDAAARTYVRQALANLREVIDDRTAVPPFLLITREEVQFNQTSDHWLDAAAFTALLAACDTHAHRRIETCSSCARRYAESAALYRGDFLAQFFLPDSAVFEEWAALKRERLRQYALRALTRLTAFYARRGMYEEAQQFAWRQVELDPWNEEAYQHLMRALWERGQRSVALAQYERCRSILARDLDVAPAVETTALYERIRDDEFRNTRTGPAEFTTFSYHFPLLHNFPPQTTPLIGRETELAELGTLLENPACRLITIVGPGGIGKTRLAVAAATEQAAAFAHGAAFIPLQPISSAAFLAPAIMAALDVELQGQRDPRDQLFDYLREKELLLVLDNLEQLLATGLPRDALGNRRAFVAAELLLDVLSHAPGVTLLITSRERLALQAEWMFDLAGLSYPVGELVDSVATYSAPQLFLQRARQVRRHFAPTEGEARAVVRICQLVEGFPLAIELAAGALRGRSCTAIASAIDSNLSVLTTGLRDVPERHRSMWATFEHSWHLLSDEEHQVFPRLSVFRGGFQADAAAQVAQASPQHLAALVDKALLRWDGVARYDLHELLRQYAGVKLREAEEAESIRRTHALYFLAQAETTEPNLLSGARDYWLERLDREHDNLRAALAWSQATADAGEIRLQLVGGLFWFWFYRSRLSEGRAWAEGALTTAGASGQPDVWAKALYSAGFLTWLHGDCAAARARLTASVEHWRETEDRRGLAMALSQLGMVLSDQNDYIVAHDLCAESVAILRELGDPWALACALFLFGNVVYDRGDYAAARPIFEESLALWRTVADPWGLSLPLVSLGGMACKQGDYATARVLLGQCLALRRQVGNKWFIASALGSLAEVALCQADYQEATARLEESLALYQELGVSNSIAHVLDGFALVAVAQVELERAVRLWGAADALRDVIGIPMPSRERLGYEQAVAAAHAQLDEVTFAAVWAEGRALSREQAIAYALKEAQ